MLRNVCQARLRLALLRALSSSIELVHVRHALLRVFDVHAHLAQTFVELGVLRGHALEAVLQLALILLELVERACVS